MFSTEVLLEDTFILTDSDIFGCFHHVSPCFTKGLAFCEATPEGYHAAPPWPRSSRQSSRPCRAKRVGCEDYVSPVSPYLELFGFRPIPSKGGSEGSEGSLRHFLHPVIQVDVPPAGIPRAFSEMFEPGRVEDDIPCDILMLTLWALGLTLVPPKTSLSPKTIITSRTSLWLQVSKGIATWCSVTM